MGEAAEAVRTHFLNPCMLFAHRQEHLVTTVLGSCVSVCLWDPDSGCGGINHYMLPLWNGEGLPTPKFGNVAIEKLLRRMLDLGCRRERLVAKAFGGADVFGNDRGYFDIGARNAQICRDMLARHGIQLAASDLGGTRPRKIVFNTCTGRVSLVRLASTPGAQPLPDGRPRDKRPGA